MCHQMPFWCGIRCQTFLEDYGCGCVWAVPELPLSHCVVCGIADSRRYTPASFCRNGPSLSKRQALGKMVSEYCSARVSRVGLSAKQTTEPYSDNLLNRTRSPSEPYSDKEIPLRRALRRFAFLVGFSTGNPPKIGTFTAWNRTRNRTRTLSDWGWGIAGKARHFNQPIALYGASPEIWYRQSRYNGTRGLSE